MERKHRDFRPVTLLAANASSEGPPESALLATRHDAGGPHPSRCLQDAFVSLKMLAVGSIILFGRHSRTAGRPAFSLDTCLVVDRVEELRARPFEADTYGGDVLVDAVLSPLYSEGIVDGLALYFGKMRAFDSGSPFSFVPARLLDGPDEHLFARPQLAPTGPLKNVVSPKNNQGINNESVTLVKRDAIWQKIVRQIAKQGCGLGYRAAAPPLVDRDSAEAASRRTPAPLSLMPDLE